MKTFLAWCVHLYTALGLVAAALMAVLIVRGGHDSFRLVFLLMIAATLIDATDGYLARKADVAHRTPRFDGRRLDDLIDFNTYTTLPLLLLWRAGVLPGHWNWVLLLPLLASAYGFSQTEAKTADDYFLGFPSYWNIVAFYLYVCRFPHWLAAAILVLFAVMTFVPLRYLYPTRGSRLGALTNTLAAIWVVCLLAIVAQWNQAPGAFVWGSLTFPAYYLIASWSVQAAGTSSTGVRSSSTGRAVSRPPK